MNNVLALVELQFCVNTATPEPLMHALSKRFAVVFLVEHKVHRPVVASTDLLEKALIHLSENNDAEGLLRQTECD